MSIGSIPRKWDLHVHTPESFHNNFRFHNKEEREKYQDDIWGKYIDELEKIEDICVIGITDYFTIEGHKKVLEYAKKDRLQNFDLILPNIEFRLDKFVEGERLNYHVIFSEEMEVERIEKEFLEDLHIKAYNAEPRKLTKENIIDIGRELKIHNKAFQGKSDYIVGCMNVTVSLDEIIKVLGRKKSIFGGKYLLVLPEELWCRIDWADYGYPQSQDQKLAKLRWIINHLNL